ncbi:MAG: SirB1 family protein [Comamonas sp.]
MDLSFSLPTPLEHFSSLVQSDSEFPLLEAAASLACIEYPQLDVQQVLNEVDQLIGQMRRHRDCESHSQLTRLKFLNHMFYSEWGFQGNANDYYAPDNSCLNVVLHKRRGIPVSLAVIWLELAAELRLQVHGVGFPGHFLLKVSLPEGQVVLDPLTGQSFSSSMLAEMLESVRPQQLRPLDDEVPLGLYLQPATPRDIIARMLGNLKEIYRSERNWPRLIEAQNRRIVLEPDQWTEVRDRGLAYVELGVKDRALVDLGEYLAHAEGASDVPEIRHRLDLLQKM